MYGRRFDKFSSIHICPVTIGTGTHIGLRIVTIVITDFDQTWEVRINVKGKNETKICLEFSPPFVTCGRTDGHVAAVKSNVMTSVGIEIGRAHV